MRLQRARQDSVKAAKRGSSGATSAGSGCWALPSTNSPKLKALVNCYHLNQTFYHIPSAHSFRSPVLWFLGSRVSECMRDQPLLFV